MAKLADELNRKVLQNLRTSGSNEYIVEKPLSNIAAEGEVIVQMGAGSTAEEKKKATGLWTLAADGTTPVRFPSEEKVEEMISIGASQDVQALSGVVEELATELDEEKTRAISADTVLANAIEEESGRAIEAEQALSGAIDDVKDAVEAEEGRAKGVESGLTQDLAELSGTVGTLSAATVAEVERLDDKIEKLAASAVTNEDGTIDVTSDDGTVISVAIKSGEHVLAKDGGEGLYTNLDLVKITSGLPSNVKERYQLLATDESQIGENIDIPKDSSLYRVYLGHVDDELTSASDPTVVSGIGDTALCFIYQVADGTYELVAVDVEDFLQESEFADGLEVNDHVVSVKIDENSEDFLTVSSDGVKLDGVQDAIDEAKTELNTEIAELSGSVETLSGAVVDNEEVVSAALNDLNTRIDQIGSGATGETARAEAAEAALDDVIGSVKAQEGETRTYGHSGTNYLDNNDQVKEDVEGLDALLGKVEESTSADTVFSSENSVAKNISDIKKALAVLQGKSIVGKDTTYADVTVAENASSETEIQVDIEVQDIATASAATDGLATAYNVKQFAVSAVKDDENHPTNVEVVSEDGVKKLDLSNLSIDCGEF